MKSRSQLIGLAAGPLVFCFIYFLTPFEDLSPRGSGVLACTAWVAIWWMTEAIPIQATALMPIILFPITGTIDIKSTTASYGNHLVFLYMGGFIVAIAIEKWHLHKRIALKIIKLIGTNPRKIILGFMLATGFMSMWISNTASTLMMLPIALSVIKSLDYQENFPKSLLLGLAYAASIGGISTIIGTPPNVVFAALLKNTFNVEISFFDWMLLALPFSVSLLVITWIFLTRIGFQIGNQAITDVGIAKALIAMGSMTIQEKRVLIVFVSMAFCWVTRGYFINTFAPQINDTMIAMIGGLSLFLISDRKNGRLIEWQDMKRLPWGILILFGGGLAIANAFVQTDLASWIGHQLNSLNTVHLIILILAISAMVNFLTEITSNLATASMILPILAALATSIKIHPYYLMVCAILACSCAFMLPIATPPNAIVFGSGKLKMTDMVRIGFFLNIISILLITIFIYWLMPNLWKIDLPNFIRP